MAQNKPGWRLEAAGSKWRALSTPVVTTTRVLERCSLHPVEIYCLLPQALVTNHFSLYKWSRVDYSSWPATGSIQTADLARPNVSRLAKDEGLDLSWNSLAKITCDEVTWSLDVEQQGRLQQCGWSQKPTICPLSSCVQLGADCWVK